MHAHTRTLAHTLTARRVHGLLTHHPVLPQHFNEVKSVETKEQNQLVLTFSVITCCLEREKKTTSMNTAICCLKPRPCTGGTAVGIAAFQTLTLSDETCGIQVLSWPYLQNLQHLVCLLLRHNGIIIETTELALQPERINIPRVQILLLRTHQFA